MHKKLRGICRYLRREIIHQNDKKMGAKMILKILVHWASDISLTLQP